MAWVLVAAGLTYVGAAAVTGPNRNTPATFEGFATGTALHVTGVQSLPDRIADVDLAFSSAMTRSNGLQARSNEFAIQMQPTQIPITGKSSSGRGSGLELGLGVAPPVDPATRQLILSAVAEATAPPDSPLVIENIAVPADPVIFAALLEGRAQAKFGSLLDRCPTLDSNGLPTDFFGFGQGTAADVQLLNTGATLPDGTMEAPLISTDTSALPVTVTRSRVLPVKNADGTFGLQAVIESEAVPIRLNLPPDNIEANDVLIQVGTAKLTVTATGQSTPTFVYTPPPTPNVIIGGTPVIALPPIIIPIPGLLEVAIAEDPPRAIGQPVGTPPNITTTGGNHHIDLAVDGVRVQLPPSLPIVDPILADLRVQHMEASLTVPAGGFSFNDCGQLRVSKNVVGGLAGPFTFHVACVPPTGGAAFTLDPSESDFQLVNGGSKTISVPTNSRCTVTEPGAGGATTTTIAETPPTGTPTIANDSAPTDGVVTIPPALRIINVAFTNANLGNLQVFKTAQSSLTGPFGFNVGCVNAAGGTFTLPAADASFQLAGGGNRLISNIPGGSVCTVTESDTGGASVTRVTDTTAPNNDGKVTIVGAATQAVTFSNAGPPLVISKIASGASGGKGPFKFHVECRDPAGATIALDAADADFTLAGGQTKAIAKDMADGSTCTVTEVDKGGATSTAVADTSGVSTTDGVVAVVHLETQTVTFTNNFVEPVKLIVSKTVTGTGTGPFAFTVACTNAAAPVTLGAGDASFTLGGGESRSIKNIPNGAICTVTETDSKGAVRSYSETSGTANDGIVTIPVDGAATVAVNNTFVKAEVIENPPVIAPRTVG